MSKSRTRRLRRCGDLRNRRRIIRRGERGAPEQATLAWHLRWTRSAATVPVSKFPPNLRDRLVACYRAGVSRLRRRRRTGCHKRRTNINVQLADDGVRYCASSSANAAVDNSDDKRRGPAAARTNRFAVASIERRRIVRITTANAVYTE